VTEIWALSATALAAKIREGEISAGEAALAALARLNEVNPRLNAVVAHRPEEVLSQAAGVDAAIARGEDPGPLAGVPVTVKVNIDQAGFATTNGVRAQEHLIARSNSPVVDNLRRAGAVILGRTNTPAFSLRWFTSNLVHGATKNPRDARLTPGGSSGGAAAAVAAGIGHLAHGTDIAGSVRYPAYACGVHGLRPSFGRVAAHNATGPERAIGPQLTAVSGPIARTIADCAPGSRHSPRRMRATLGMFQHPWKGPPTRAAPSSACALGGSPSCRKSRPFCGKPPMICAMPAGWSRNAPISRTSMRPPSCKPGSGPVRVLRPGIR